MKVLLVDTMSSVNDFTVELVKGLEERVELTVFTVEGSRIKTLPTTRFIAAFPAHYGEESKAYKLLKQAKACLRLAVEVVRHRKGFIHIQSFRSVLFEAPIYFFSSILWRKNLFYTAHNVLPHEVKKWHKKFFALWYAAVFRIHVLGSYAQAQLIREFGISPSKIANIPHGNYENFKAGYNASSPTVDKKKLGIPEDAFILLMFGFVRRYKGVDRALRALARLPKESKSFLVVAGTADGGLGAELRDLADRQGVAHRVVFKFEHLSNSELAEYISLADVTLFPYEHIYQSGAVILAMTFGKPIIASALDGMRDYLHDETTAILCDSADPASLAGAIMRFENDCLLRGSIADAARKFASDQLSWNRICDALTQMYQRVPR